MSTEKNTDLKPPYVAYKTFANTIASLRESGLPDRIDRSVFPGMSGAAQSYLLMTLKFLGFITDEGSPTASLKELVKNANNEKTILAAATKEKYNFVFDGGFNILAATEAQLNEKFRERGLSGDTIRKGVSFFTLLCNASGIAISPHLKGKRGPSSGTGIVRRPYKKRKNTSDFEDASNHDRPQPPAAAPKTFQEILLAKFPDFDPKWDADTQKKWFENFERFMTSAKKVEA